MLWEHVGEVCIGGLLFALFCLIAAAHAYYVDLKRPLDDPQKKHYKPAEILLAPITVPFLLVGRVVYFVLKAISYGVLLVLLTIALLIISEREVVEGEQRSSRCVPRTESDDEDVTRRELLALCEIEHKLPFVTFQPEKNFFKKKDAALYEEDYLSRTDFLKYV